MSIKKWFKTKRLFAFFGWLAALLCISLEVAMIYVAQNNLNNRSPDMSLPEIFTLICWLALLICASFCLTEWRTRNRQIRKLQIHLNIDDLHPYMEFSPSAIEDICLRRLRVLASAWEEAQRNHSMPFAKQRAEAETAFRKAYWFFEEQKCIKPTSWEQFFQAAK